MKRRTVNLTRIDDDHKIHTCILILLFLNRPVIHSLQQELLRRRLRQCLGRDLNFERARCRLWGFFYHSRRRSNLKEARETRSSQKQRKLIPEGIFLRDLQPHCFRAEDD